jgi:TonB family protein
VLLRLSVTVAALASAVLASAAGAKFANTTIGGVTHDEAGAVWSDSLQRELSDNCDRPGVAKPIMLRPVPGEKVQGSIDCVENILFVDNRSALPLQCHGIIELPQPEQQIESRRESDLVVFPGIQHSIVVAVGRAEDMPTRFTSSCRVIPAEPPAHEVAPKECDLVFRAPSANDFYPPASLRREEQGAVMLEYALDPASRKAIDVLIMKSSGFADLDNAALKYSKYFRGTSNCPERRYRSNVRFSIHDGRAETAPATVPHN